MMKRRAVFLIVALAATTILGDATALAADRIDQRNMLTEGVARFGSGVFPVSQMQTFTAGATGTIDKVSIYLQAQTSTPSRAGSVLVQVFPGDDAGNADMSHQPLGSGSALATTFPDPAGWVTIRLTTRAAVRKGTRYALVVGSDVSTDFGWYGSTEDQYPRGRTPFDANADYFFQTYLVHHRRHH